MNAHKLTETALEYISIMERNQIRPEALKAVRTRFKAFILPYLKDDLSEINEPALIAYFRRLDEVIKPNAAGREAQSEIYSNLNNFLEWSAKRGYIGANPLKNRDLSDFARLNADDYKKAKGR